MYINDTPLNHEMYTHNIMPVCELRDKGSKGLNNANIQVLKTRP